MTKSKRALLTVLPIALAGIVAAVAISIAQGADAPPAGDVVASSPEEGSRAQPRLIPFEAQENFTPGVPEGPHIEFCPTPRQVQEFAEQTGGRDLKPSPPGGVGCSSRGAWIPPDPAPSQPLGEEISEQEACEIERQKMLQARPLPSQNPNAFDGVLSDGTRIGVRILGTSRDDLKGMDINDLAEDWC